MRFFLIIAGFVLCSCSSITFVADEGIQSGISSKKSLKKKEIIYENEYNFLLWGAIPLNHTVDLAQSLSRSYINSVGNISIQIYQTPTDQLVTYLSLGLFYRHRIRVKGWGDVIELK